MTNGDLGNFPEFFNWLWTFRGWDVAITMSHVNWRESSYYPSYQRWIAEGKPYQGKPTEGEPTEPKPPSEEEEAFWEWYEGEYGSESVTTLKRYLELSGNKLENTEYWNHYFNIHKPWVEEQEEVLASIPPEQKKFWDDWLNDMVKKGVYTPAEVVRLQGARNIKEEPQWGYFIREVYGIKPGEEGYVPETPETTRPLGRAYPEKFSITDADWKTLLLSSPDKANSILNQWLSSGYIGEREAYDIAGEYSIRQQKGIASLIGTPVETPEERAARKEQERQVEAQAQAEKFYREAPLSVRLSPEAYQDITRQRTWKYAPPKVDYEPGIEQLRGELERELPKTETWTSWLNYKLSRLPGEFKAVTKFTQEAYPGMMPLEVQPMIEESWEAYLKKAKPKIKEAGYRRSAYERGERPSVYQPRIQTVGF